MADKPTNITLIEADCGQHIAFLYTDGNAVPMGAVGPGRFADVAREAASWCEAAAEWDGSRHAVISYHHDDLRVWVEGYVGRGELSDKAAVLNVRVVEEGPSNAG